MIRSFAAAAALLTTAVLTGCGSTDSHSEPGTAPAPAASSPAAAATDPDTGYIDVEIGKPFQISNQDGPTATVTLLQVEIDPVCTTRFGTPTPPAGTNVALEFDVETTSTPPDKYISYLWFEELTPENYTRRLPIPSETCIGDREEFGSNWNPNSKYRGWVLVDISNPESDLLMSDIWDSRMPPEIHRIPLN